MNLGIVGSRSFKNYDLMKQVVADFRKHHSVRRIISGGAHGADYLAERLARELDLPVFVFSADWEKYGKGAGFIRNKEIVNASDRLIAFWDGKSKGTAHTIALARKAGKPTTVVRFTVQPEALSQA